LLFKPCFPFEWTSVTVQYRYGKSNYHITVYQLTANEESWWKSEASEGKGNTIQLSDDGLEHRFEMHVRS
jgi:cyclic beta-1,2-glucan glucanotransferase